jgi:hypothetical protein
MAAMTEREKLLRDIQGLRESINLNWVDLARLDLSSDERAGIRQNTELLVAELQELLKRLSASDSIDP